MAKNYCRPWCVFACIITVLIGFDYAQASSSERPCTVREVLDSGGYSYIRCQEGSSDVWIGTTQISVSVGEQISFTDAPPMVNFQSKSLDRSFPRIIFTGVTRSGESQSNFNKSSYSRDSVQKESVKTDKESIFSGSDENGTIVFSDDPSKVPNKRHKNYTNNKEPQRSVNNKTPMGKFNKDERAVILNLQKVLTVYCSGDLNDYRKTLHHIIKPEVDKLIRENGSNAFLNDIRQLCYREFTVNKIFFGQGIPNAPQTKTASAYFTTSVPTGHGEDNEQTIIEALFAFDKATWKFIVFGSTWGGNYSIEEVLSRKGSLALEQLSGRSKADNP